MHSIGFGSGEKSQNLVCCLSISYPGLLIRGVDLFIVNHTVEQYFGKEVANCLLELLSPEILLNGILEVII